eukprot:m.70834 g.70834  ORF g.70834 m.70834 type:complete len:345 (-) comp10036_c0_seq2:180-1214(-)
MGCLASKDEAPTKAGADTPSGGYSWDKRAEVDPKDFTIKGLRGESVARAPGKLNGQIFVIADCHDTDIYVFDHTASVTVDDCVNCTIFLGPIKGSIFVRDCSNCRLVVSCQQFRSRDCHDCEVLLHVGSVPIIESTKAIAFGCFRGSYFQLPKQFESAGLSQYVNFWHQIHDFTKSSEGLNYSLTAEPPTWLPEFFERKPKDVAHVQVDLDPAGATVPLTAGPTGSSAGDTPTLALAFAKKQAKDLFVTILEQGAGATLVSTNEVKLRESEIDRLFATSENEQYKQNAAESAVFGFVYSGPQSGSAVAKAVSGLGGDAIYVSANSATGAKELEVWESLVATRTE